MSTHYWNNVLLLFSVTDLLSKIEIAYIVSDVYLLKYKIKTINKWVNLVVEE